MSTGLNEALNRYTHQANSYCNLGVRLQLSLAIRSGHGYLMRHVTLQTNNFPLLLLILRQTKCGKKSRTKLDMMFNPKSEHAKSDRAQFITSRLTDDRKRVFLELEKTLIKGALLFI